MFCGSAETVKAFFWGVGWGEERGTEGGAEINEQCAFIYFFLPGTNAFNL